MKGTSPPQRDELNFWQDLWLQARLTWLLLRDPAVPVYLKLIPAAAVIYLIFPFDVVPDLWPVLGQLDDLTALLLGAKIFIELCPQEVVARHMAILLPEKSVEDAIVIDAEQGK